MKYKPITAVWEITMGCNLRCKHCGSSCEGPMEGELTTEEALKLCDDLGQLEFKWITLSGGEPTTRKDWHLIAKRLCENNIIPNMITNGWLLNEEIIDKAVEAGINTIAISIDGLENTHDLIRKPGSFKKDMAAFDLLKNKNINYGAITTINSINIKELEELKAILIEKGLMSWQLQLGLPMGNLAKNIELVAKPSDVDILIDFAHRAMLEGKIQINLGDCVGYYNLKEIQVRNHNKKTEQYQWNGCGAGRCNLGILHNGDIVGCTSIRSREFIEGNIKEIPIKEIWENPDSFSWNRSMKKEQLNGLCKICKYGSSCRGGCSNAKLTTGGSIHAENKFCSYNFALSRAKRQFDKIESIEELNFKGKKFIEKGNLQLAELALAKAAEIDCENEESLKLLGYSEFMLTNYDESKLVNEKLLSMNPEDAYANKGMGLCLCKLGEVDEGIAYLRKAIALTDENFLDPYYDLAITLLENNRKQEAIDVIEEAKEKFKGFEKLSKMFYETAQIQ
ncbi:radical SAM protein [Clostridium sp. 19966]|uniref:radical SAM/SPASM domain-containing protein n=1 Tax=Clostridium sp. 19966 TaxID=2768166 RepID=UPI0028E032F3|nr:radical SAM protein [Clostridium sp. 19966]MDT8717556.1 radical SAM protein [Clostridium sp. 19966]